MCFVPGQFVTEATGDRQVHSSRRVQIMAAHDGAVCTIGGYWYDALTGECLDNGSGYRAIRFN